MKQRAMIFGNVPKLPMKWATVVMPFFLSCLMSGIISLINMIRNLGWIEGFFTLWLHNWMISGVCFSSRIMCAAFGA